MTTQCKCLACQLRRKAMAMDEDIDDLIYHVSEAQDRRGPDDDVVRLGWQTVELLIAEQRNLYGQADMSERELQALERRRAHPRGA